jgi:trk system potassium uptake protein TrkH
MKTLPVSDPESADTSSFRQLTLYDRMAPVLHVLGVVLTLFGSCMIVPFAASILLRDGAESAYVKAIVVTFAAGCVLLLVTRGRQRREIQPRDGFVLVALVWTVLPAFATVPLLAQFPALSFTDAYFECVSGLTASGGTVLSGLDAFPVSINLWRTLMIWLGGMGIIVLTVAILPLLGVGGSQLFRAEMAGPMKDTRLTPRIEETAKGLWLVYFTLTAACAAAYRLAGMGNADAVMHAFTTVGLGGFSSHDASFGHFDSPAIEAVAVIFMLLSAINYTVHFVAFRKRALGTYSGDPEARAMLVWLVLGTVMIAGHLWAHGTYDSLATALRHAVFHVVSIGTTTGYSSTDYAQWPVFAPAFLLFLSCFFASAGSTGGGIKMIRAIVLFRQALRELTRIVHPTAVVQVKVSGRVIETSLIFAVLAYMLMYGATIIVMMMLLMASGLDIVTAVSAVIASINNMGPGLGLVGPASTFGPLSDFQTWVCTLTMLLGRLELFALIVLLTPAFWRK